MKRLLPLLALFLCLGITACNPVDRTDPETEKEIDPLLDYFSLAEWAYTASGRPISVEGEFNGVPISDFRLEESRLYFEAVSDTEVYLESYIYFGDPNKGEYFEIRANRVPINGDTDKIVFDAEVSGEVRKWDYSGGNGDTAGKISITGEITKVKLSEYEFYYDTELRFDCQYKIDVKGTQFLTMTVKSRSKELYEPHPGTLPDASLTGSISFNGIYHPIDMASGKYDSAILTDLHYDSMLCIGTVSDSEVWMDCHAGWKEGHFTVKIPSINVLGEPYNATLDATGVETEISVYNEVENRIVKSPATVAVSGWMKAQGVTLGANGISLGENGETFVLPIYYCDIHIVCHWMDEAGLQHTLDFKIKKIDSLTMILVD